MQRWCMVVVVLFSAVSLSASEQILPVFALNVPGVGGSLWTSELTVTNPGPVAVVVHERSLIGRTSGGVPCLPIVQPFLNVEPHSTRVWSAAELSLGFGCAESAAGAMSFFSEGDVVIRSRIVNTDGGEPPAGPLRGFGQEVDAVEIANLPQGSLMLPGVTWHPNSCGPPAFDTNVFFANPGVSPVRVSMRLQGGTGEDFIVVDGIAMTPPFEFTVEPNEFRQHRIAAADSPLTVCLSPAVGSLLLELDGPLAILGSVIDRGSGDARTLSTVAVSP